MADLYKDLKNKSKNRGSLLIRYPTMMSAIVTGSFIFFLFFVLIEKTWPLCKEKYVWLVLVSLLNPSTIISIFGPAGISINYTFLERYFLKRDKNPVDVADTKYDEYRSLVLNKNTITHVSHLLQIMFLMLSWIFSWTQALVFLFNNDKISSRSFNSVLHNYILNDWVSVCFIVAFILFTFSLGIGLFTGSFANYPVAKLYEQDDDNPSLVPPIKSTITWWRIPIVFFFNVITILWTNCYLDMVIY